MPIDDPDVPRDVQATLNAVLDVSERVWRQRVNQLEAALAAAQADLEHVRAQLHGTRQSNRTLRVQRTNAAHGSRQLRRTLIEVGRLSHDPNIGSRVSVALTLYDQRHIH